MSRNVVIGSFAILATVWMLMYPAAGDLRARGLRQSPAGPSPATAEHRAFLETYCVGCHNERLRAADLTLDTTLADVASKAEVWEKVVRKLRIGAMPPPGRPRPAQPAADRFASWITGEIDEAAARHPNPGTVDTFHRLNRAEYRNAIRDLLALDVDVSSLLPPDDMGRDGFDNDARMLSVSPTLLERYFVAARKLSRLAVGFAPVAPESHAYPIHSFVLQDDQVSEDLPFGSQGGTAVRHYFPADGEYTVAVRLRRTGYDYIMGLGDPHELQVRLNGALVASFPVGGEKKGTPAPLSFSGNIRGDAAWEDYALHADAGLKVRVRTSAGAHIVGVSFVARPAEPEGIFHRPEFISSNILDDDKPYSDPAVELVTIDGPFVPAAPSDTVSRRKIFRCRPTSRKEETPCARAILSSLARQAFRRSVSAEESNMLLRFYDMGRAEGSFDTGIQLGVERLLADPRFLLRIERTPPGIAPGATYEISQFELASRLSFFLWSTIPDETLLDLAVRGKLREPAVLRAQVQRMLVDARAVALVENFASQWLQLRDIAAVTPNLRQFPHFDETLRESMRRETELFIESTIREDRSVMALLTANYTFLNERLARHYGIPNVYGERFRRVTLDDDGQRGGLLGHASLLTVTSYPTRTSPVVRGKWLLENILGTPPPPPPPNVPGLPERPGDKPTSVRQQLEEHRKNVVCASCHATMDPLGFALESFDALGMWRTVADGGAPVDATGSLPTGARFEGPSGLRTWLLGYRESLVNTLVGKLLGYAVGREVEYFDLPTIRKVTAEAAASDHRWSAVILGVVNSPAFRMRRTPSSPPIADASTVRR